MAAEIPAPGVEVIQVFRTTSPTIVTPTLPACILGACKQIVEATVQSAAGGSAINPDALVQLPAMLEATAATGDPPEYTLGADGALCFSPNHRPPVTVLFDAGTYTPADVVAKILAALLAAGETDATAKVIGKDPTTGKSWLLRTTAAGDGQQLEIDPNGQVAASIVGTVDINALGGGNFGSGGTLDTKTLIYNVNGTPVTVTFNAPADAGAVVSQISSALGVNGTASLQATTNFLVTSTDDTTLGATASITLTGGTAAAILGYTVGQTDAGEGSSNNVLSAFGFTTKDIAFGEGSYQGHEVRIPQLAYPDPRENLDELSMELSTVRAFVGVSGGSTVLEALRTTSLLRKGGAVTAVDDGNGDNLTPFVNMAGEDFTSVSTPPSAATIKGTGAPTFGSLSGKTLILSDGRHPRTVLFGTCATIADVVGFINAEFNTGDGILAADDTGELRLTSTKTREDGATLAKGEDSAVVLLGGTALTPTNLLDSDASPTLKIGRFTGNPYKVSVGDELYVDGVFAGKVLQVAPNGVTTRLRLDRQLSTSFTGTSFKIIARGLQPLPSGAADRPSPDLIVDSLGTATLKLGIFRTPQGKVVESVSTAALLPAKGLMYLSYRALRLDVTARAETPGLLRFNSTVDVDQLLAPVNADNPLALGLYMALVNAPDAQVFGLGVDEISADMPEGTVEGFTRAAEYIEGHDVYGIAPMTHSEDVAAIMMAHVKAMSAPSSKGERVVVWNPAKPAAKRHTTVASGSNGNTVGSTGLEFDTGVGNLAALLLAAGIDASSAIDAEEGLFLDIASDDNHYSIASVSGSVVTVRITFAPGENDDAFYSTTDLNDSPLPAALLEEPFAVRVRGAELKLTDGRPDKDGMAETLAATGQAFSSNRVWQVMPDKCTAVIGGLEQLIEGYYACAAIVGMVSQQPPQQSFTNFPMAGITSIKGSNDFFTDKQLNKIAGGGNWILIQGAGGGPVFSRMALTTDVSSIELRTDSIIKVVDFTAKFLRRSLKNYIGRFNISQGFLDTLGTTLEGLLSYLKENGVLNAAVVNNIVQDEAAPDTVVIDVSIDVPYPCNYIRLTLVI